MSLYNLIAYSCMPDTYEVNDTNAIATNINYGQDINAAIDNQKDYDWYKITTKIIYDSSGPADL